MDKRLMLQLNCNRKITGVLRGFDPFMNIVLDEAVEERSAEQRIPMGLAVCCGGGGTRWSGCDAYQNDVSIIFVFTRWSGETAL